MWGSIMLKESYKNGKFLEFKFDDGKICKYDLSTGDFYGKSGRKVKNLNSYFKNISLYDFIKTFPNKNYSKYLSFCNKKINRSIRSNNAGHFIPASKYTNISSFLGKINKYSMYEQYFSAGIYNISSNELKKSIKECPSGLIKILKKIPLLLNDDLIDCYNKYQNEFNYVFNSNVLSINKKEFLENFFIDSYINIKNGYDWNDKYKKTFVLIENGYKFSSLFKYYDKIYTCEAVSINDITNHLYDYRKMMSSISNKFEKYPRNLLTTHNIAVRNYNRLKKEYPDELFKKRIDNRYNYEKDEYIFIYPNSVQDIKDEAVMQNNCVVSYIDDVIEGKTNIIFMRFKKNKDKSLVTLEFNGSKCIQAYRAYNQPLTERDEEVLEKYEKRLEKALKS